MTCEQRCLFLSPSQTFEMKTVVGRYLVTMLMSEGSAKTPERPCVTSIQSSEMSRGNSGNSTKRCFFSVDTIAEKYTDMGQSCNGCK